MKQFNNNVYLIERIISSGTYLTAGMLGFVWFIISAIFRKTVTPFLMYHIMQSIFISIAYFLLVELCKLLYIILYKIPLINAIPYFINMPLQFLFGLSILQFVSTIFILYLAFTAFLGMYSYIPWVSDIINGNTGRK